MKIIFESDSFSIASSLSRKNTPQIDGVFFHSIKNALLGRTYELSLVFIGAKKMRALNTSFRQKQYATDILTFTLSSDDTHGSGEILIYPTAAYRKSALFDRTPENYLQYLFIHGIAHLLAHDHETESDTALMEIFEQRACKKFHI